MKETLDAGKAFVCDTLLDIVLDGSHPGDKIDVNVAIDLILKVAARVVWIGAKKNKGVSEAEWHEISVRSGRLFYEILSAEGAMSYNKKEKETRYDRRN